ncbi:MAG TPA: Smr/MutS family protein [Rhizomicrobium sp.]|nr:Smr/MutS family protein [Rhizomicrobium sp.]
MNRRRRETSDEERALFQSTFHDARPLDPTLMPDSTPAEARVGTKPSQQKTGTHAGLDGRTAERLRRGQLEPQGKLDLHGMTEAAAHRALSHFLYAAQARGARLVLVVTGKGGKPTPENAPFDMELERRARGVLKTVVPRWLAEPDLAPLVADSRAAHRRHGGAGALYVYLRKR